MFFLYLLENTATKKFYIGVTKDLERRVKEHNKNKVKFTGRNKFQGGWKLLYFLEFKDEAIAYKEELRLKKSKNKKYILWYFKNKTGRVVPT